MRRGRIAGSSARGVEAATTGAGTVARRVDGTALGRGIDVEGSGGWCACRGRALRAAAASCWGVGHDDDVDVEKSSAVVYVVFCLRGRGGRSTRRERAAIAPWASK